MFKLVFADMRKNLKLFWGTFISVFVATVIVTACLNLVFSSTDKFTESSRFSKADFVVTANYDVTITTVDDDGDVDTEREKVDGWIYLTDEQIAYLEENYTIIKDYTFNLRLKDLQSGKIAGHNFSSIALSELLLSGNEPSRNQVVVDENLAIKNSLKIGDFITIFTNNSTEEYEISGIATATGNENFAAQNYIFFDDITAKENSLGCNSVAILDDNVTVSDFDEDEFTVYSGEKTYKAELPSIATNDISLMVIFITMGSVCLVISLFVISGAMQFSVKNRFTLLTKLRVIGLKKSQIYRILSSQTLVVSLFATASGVLFSDSLANLIASLYYKMGIVDSDFEVTFSFFWGAIVAAGITTVSLVISTISSSKTLSISPASAIKSEGEIIGKTSVTGIIFGVIFILGGTSILIFAPMTQGVGIGMGFCATTVFLAGAILLTPILIKFLNLILSVITKRFAKSLGRVAYGNIKMKASKFAVASVSISIMMSMGSVMMLNNETYVNSLAETQYELSGDYEYIAGAKFQHQLVESEQFFASKTTNVILRQGENLNDYNALAVLGNLPDIKITEQENLVHDNYVFISEDIKKAEVGDTLEVYLENGEKNELIVGGKFDTKGISDENYSIIIDYNFISDSLYNAAFSSVYSKDKIFDDSVENNLEYYQSSPSFDIQNAASVLLGFIGITLSIVALFNTFFVIMSVRRKEFAGLKLIGARKNQIFKMTFLEVLVVTLTGMTIGLSVLVACVGAYSYENIGVFDFIVNETIFYGTIVLTAFLGIFSGILASILAVKK